MAIAPLEQEKIVVEPKGEPVIKVEPPQVEYETKRGLVRGRQILWYIWLVIEVILLLRFLLRLFGASSDVAFNILITIISFPAVFLFQGLFKSTVSPDGKASIEWSTLFAMLTYAIIAIVVHRYFKLKKPIDPKEAEEKLES